MIYLVATEAILSQSMDDGLGLHLIAFHPVLCGRAVSCEIYRAQSKNMDRQIDEVRVRTTPVHITE